MMLRSAITKPLILYSSGSTASTTKRPISRDILIICCLNTLNWLAGCSIVRAKSLLESLAWSSITKQRRMIRLVSFIVSYCSVIPYLVLANASTVDARMSIPYLTTARDIPLIPEVIFCVTVSRSTLYRDEMSIDNSVRSLDSFIAA